MKTALVTKGWTVLKIPAGQNLGRRTHRQGDSNFQYNPLPLTFLQEVKQKIIMKIKNKKKKKNM